MPIGARRRLPCSSGRRSSARSGCRLTPWLNHSWQVPLYVTARGLATSPIPAGGEILEIEFDFIDHRLDLPHQPRRSARSLSLAPQTVADFYRQLMGMLADLGRASTINVLPNEMRRSASPSRKTACMRAYDAAAAHRFWRALIQVDRVFKLFRTGFLGKASPVHFFWGSFDLAVDALLRPAAPPHPGGVPGLPDAVDARGLFARGQQRRLLAGQRRVPAGRLLFLRLSGAAGLREPAGHDRYPVRGSPRRIHPAL